MCPLRFILVFFSAVLAGYLAWKTVSSSDEPNAITTPDVSTLENKETFKNEKREFHFFKIVQNGFWVFIDMASGRYLWRNVKQLDSTSQRVS